MIAQTDRSRIFSNYNRLRKDAEKGRLNRALGLAQSQAERPYTTTADSCTCPDWQYRHEGAEGFRCKHQLLQALALPALSPECRFALDLACHKAEMDAQAAAQAAMFNPYAEEVEDWLQEAGEAVDELRAEWLAATGQPWRETVETQEWQPDLEASLRLRYGRRNGQVAQR